LSKAVISDSKLSNPPLAYSKLGVSTTLLIVELAITDSMIVDFSKSSEAGTSETFLVTNLVLCFSSLVDVVFASSIG